MDIADEILDRNVGYYGPASLSQRGVTGSSDSTEDVDVSRPAFPDRWYTAEDVTAGDVEIRARWQAMGTRE